MYERRDCAGDSAYYIVSGEIFELCNDVGIIHAIDNLILSNIVEPNNDDEMIKPVQQLP